MKKDPAPGRADAQEAGNDPPWHTPKSGERVSGPAIALFCQMAIITLLSPDLAKEWLPLTGISLAVAGVGLWLWRQAGGSWLPLLFGLLAGLTASLWEQRPLPPLPAELINQSITLEGVIVERQDRPDSVQLLLEQGVAPAEANRLPAPLSVPGVMQITLTLPQEQLPAIPGDRIALRTRLKPVTSSRNPGGFDYARFQQQHNILSNGSSREPVRLIEPATSWSWNRYRQTISQWIAREIPPETRGLVEALMVGKTGWLEKKLSEDLMVSGTYHLVAISGLQVGLVAGWSFFLLRLLLALCTPLSRRWDLKRPVALLTLLPTLAYAFLAGWSVSTQRASLMAAFLLLAIALGRARPLWRVLVLTAMAILACQPGQLFAAGFQLSFLCVVGLMFFMPWFEKGKGWRKFLLGLVMTTAVASLITTPVAAHYFHRTAPYGWLANLLAVPWVSGLSTPLGLLALIAHELHAPLGDWLLHRMGESLEPYRLFIAWISTLPGAWHRLAGPSLTGLALSLGLCALAGLVGMAGFSRWRVLLFLLAWPALLWPRTAPPPEQLHLAVLDVGQAQSVVLRTPNGGWSVFDAGGFASPRFNPGEAFTSSYLWHLGVERLQRLVISHPQTDHMAGAEQLLRNFRVAELWLADFPVEEEENSMYASLLARAEADGVAIHRIRQGLCITEGEARITVLPPFPVEAARDDNDRSLVVEIAFGEHRFLLPADASKRTEKWLLSQQAIRPLTMLLAPHHGSRSSSSPDFVQASQPRHVVFSAGRYNPHHHPHPQVVQRWQQASARIWRTDQQGAILFQSDGQKLQVRAAAESRAGLAKILWEQF